MANQFSVTPLGGLDVGAKMTSVIEGGRKQHRIKQMREKAPEIFSTGDPSQIANFMVEYPEMAQTMERATGVQDAGHKQQIVDMAKGLLTPGADPKEVIAQYSNTLQQSGRDPKMAVSMLSKIMTDPAQADEMGRKLLAIHSPAEFTAYQKATMAGAGVDKGTANIQDWNYYQKIKRTNPQEAELFAKQVGITTDRVSGLKPTTAMQNIDRWSAMEEGPSKTAFGRMIGVDPKKSMADQVKQAERVDTMVTALDGAQGTLDMVNTIFDNDKYIDALTGFRGATPFAVPGGTGYDAQVAFDQFKDSLTMDNLGKMKGVLTDKDMAIIRSASAGINPGMSKKAFVRQLNKIKTILDKKIARQQGKLEGMGYNPQQTQLPEGVTEEDIQLTMTNHNVTREEVLSRLGGGQ